MRFTAALSLAFIASASAAENYLGFNSGATKDDTSAKLKEDFLAEFKTAQNLEGAPGTFNAVRLYTNIQAETEDDPISAFEAAIETKTKMLLGVWASGTDNIDKELSALKKAVEKYGTKFTDLVIGISIGSEDLYRISETGIKNKSGVGAEPDTIIGFIKDFKDSVKGTGLAKIPVGHVDTWDVWDNSTNQVVVDAVDFLGVDEYPYYEGGKGNAIQNSGKLFSRAYDATLKAAGGKPVWVTETGWPATGPDWDEAVSSVENAEYFWKEVGCKKLFNKTPTFWYNLRDSNPDNKMKFAITENLSTKPLFDLSCKNVKDDEPVPVTPTASGTASDSPKTGVPTSSTSGASSPSGTTSAGNTLAPSSTNDADTEPTADGSSNSGSGSAEGSSEGSDSTPEQAGAAAQMVSIATCAGLAIVAGAFALL